MLKHFYRLMIVAVSFFLASSCHSTPLYGIEQTDFDDGTVDEDVAENETITPDDDFDVPVDPDEDTPPDKDAVDAEGFDSESEVPDEDGDDPEFEDTLYGCPTVEFHVEGAVSAVGGSPIEGIAITYQLSEYSSTSQVLSGSDGTFFIQEQESCGLSPQDTAMLGVMDIDGATNGRYQDKEVSVPLECTYDPSDFGYYTCTNIDVKIELEEVSSDDDALLPDE
ncbi:MAG TPA: radical SAM-associated putative lipoprotein [bacterium]|nr:radical SAM-associated putative lipoprotein [bacterium]